MKKLMILVMTLLLVNLAFADDGIVETYRPNEVFTFNLHLSDNNGEVDNGNCSVQIRNSTLEVVLDDTFINAGGGWYNYSYNNSKVGKYYCRQNCTRTSDTQYVADTCDFIIGGGNKMSVMIAIGFILAFVIAFYLYMIKNMNFESFNSDSVLGIMGGIKILILASSFWIVLIPLNFAMYLTDTYTGVPALTSTINAFYIFCIAANTLITFYLFFFVLKRLIDKLQGK